MKCPECGAPTEVISTRSLSSGYARRRECFNLHRFSTRELVVPPTGPLIDSRRVDSYKPEEQK